MLYEAFHEYDNLSPKLKPKPKLNGPMGDASADVGTLVKLDQPPEEQPVPEENEVLTRPFLVDSVIAAGAGSRRAAS